MAVHGRVEGHGKGVLHKQQGLFGEEKNSSCSKDMLIEAHRRAWERTRHPVVQAGWTRAVDHGERPRTFRMRCACSRAAPAGGDARSGKRKNEAGCRGEMVKVKNAKGGKRE